MGSFHSFTARVAVSRSKLTPDEVVNCVGGHAAAGLGIDLSPQRDGDAPLGRWLIAVCLTGVRVDDAAWQRAFAQLDSIGMADPIAIAKNARGSAELTSALLEAERADAEAVAWKLMRISAALVKQYGGSVDALARSADSLEELGGRLAALAPGFGAASVTRFLRPLRDRWAQTSELPLHPSACSAAIHLGLLDTEPDPEGALGALREALANSDTRADSSAFCDLEAALERLGVWCRRNRTKTCPLQANCPARELKGQP